jgi:plastocyanin
MNRTFSLSGILRRGGMLAAVAAAALLVGGCGGGSASDSAGDSDSAGQHSGSMKSMDPTMSMGSPSAAGAVLTLTGTEYSFAPVAMTAKVGKTTIRFTNKGAMEHDFTIDALDVHITAQPGKTAEATVTLKPGTYKSTCAVPGHSQSGMQGTLTVS